MKIVFFLFLVFISCSGEKPGQKVEPFPVEKVLHAEKIWMNNVIYPGWMMLKGQNLYLVDLKSDSLLSKYSLPDLKLLYKGGVRGHANHEFQALPRLCRTMSDKIYIWGYTPFIVRGFSIDDDHLVLSEVEYKLPISDDIANERHIIRDSIMIYNSGPTKLGIKKVNLNRQKEEGEILFEEDSHRESFFYSNSGNIAVNDSLIIYAYTYKNQIDFYRVDDLKLIRSLVGDNVNPNIVVGDYENCIFYHLGVIACEKFFYVKYEGREKNISIEVFDYSGHSVAKYGFDIPPQCFDVDENNRIIYGYNQDYEDYILRYSF